MDAINAGSTAGSAVASGTTVTINSISLTGSFPASGTLNLNDGTWSNQGDAASTTFSRTFASPVTVTNSDASIIATSEQMMVIPKASGETTITATVDYDVTTTDTKLNAGSVTINNVLTSSGSVTIQGGKKYKLILVLGLTSVKLDVAVADWPNDFTGSAEVNLPLND